MGKRLFSMLLFFMIIMLCSIADVATVKAHHVADHYTGHWRLPFNGTVTTTNSPGEDTHVGTSIEAIDYAGTFPVYAPADGQIMDFQYVLDFGWVLRIKHYDQDVNTNVVVSFYAHMVGNSISHWNPNDLVSQGELIGTSGSSGTGAEENQEHLHFEARTDVTSGPGNNVYSGFPASITGIPGQWWHNWYSPAPNFQSNLALTAGGAEYPPVFTQPSTVQASGQPVRHLANSHLTPAHAAPTAFSASPNDPPAVYLTNITNIVSFNWGGRPTTPSNAQLEATYQMQVYKVSTNSWFIPPGGHTQNPGVAYSMNYTDQCRTNGQHCAYVWVHNNQNSWSTHRQISWHQGNSATNQPYISVSHPSTATNPDIAILNYGTPNATYYSVWEDISGGAPPTGIYAGSATSIRAVHATGRDYIVGAWNPTTGWVWSVWIDA